jgi:CRP/FNR family cyclic AMP-dependent transcriptional regulator
MESGALGTIYNDGQAIIRQGEEGDCMYVIQAGKVEVSQNVDGRDVPIATRGEGEFFGEMSIFEREVRMATVRAVGTVRVITVDRKNLMRRIQEDPSLAFRLLQTMSHRLRELSGEMAQQKMK